MCLSFMDDTNIFKIELCQIQFKNENMMIRHVHILPNSVTIAICRTKNNLTVFFYFKYLRAGLEQWLVTILIKSFDSFRPSSSVNSALLYWSFVLVKGCKVQSKNSNRAKKRFCPLLFCMPKSIESPWK